jgi:serine/threonine protein kinase
LEVERMSAERRAGADEREQAPAGGEVEVVPAPGLEVGGFTLEKQLGAGSFGTVFRAHRDGYWFAVKFILLARAEHWAERELQVMARLPRECGAALESHGQRHHHRGAGEGGGPAGHGGAAAPGGAA